MSDEQWHKGLTEKQRRFCEIYAANGGNAMAAARQAGYSQPQVQGRQNLEKALIKEALETLRQETTNSAIATREERQAFWSRVMRGEETEPGDAPPAMKDRLKAAELLGKSQADFIERRDHTSSDGSMSPPDRIEIVPGDNGQN